ncbi:MAG: hypothetical protein O6758_03335, partial [Planctomycetota bacterium]|nr:hypothetical protein [Planctomycetota bacterium]
MTATRAITIVLAQADADGPGATWWETIQSGGAVGYVILGLSVLALALIIMHLVQIRRGALIPAVQLEHLDEVLAQGRVSAALEYCLNPDH